jgi:hypothetical protein
MKNPMVYCRLISKGLLYLGLFLNVMGINLKKNLVLVGMTVGNIIFYIPSLWMPFRRYGPDTMAYVNQAG